MTDQPPAEPWTPLGLALRSLMSDLSEERWAAGWLDGTEYAIWDGITGHRTEWGLLNAEALAPIDAVSLAGHCWVAWRDGQTVQVNRQAWADHARNRRSEGATR